jgi:mono/diheme cytochrome c family protein
MVTASLLLGCSAHTSDASRVPPAPPEDTGARIYSGSCAACHQQDARGIPGVYPSLVGSPILLGDPRELAAWVVKGRRPATMPVGRYSTRMPQFGWLTAKNAAALLTYVRSHFGNSAPPVDVATVERVL